MKKIWLIFAVLVAVTGALFFLFNKRGDKQGKAGKNIPVEDISSEGNSNPGNKEKQLEDNNSNSPLAIENLRAGKYSGGNFVIEEELPNGSNYQQYMASYQSERLSINGLLTVPLSAEPEGGYPAIVFLHGYIPPSQYSTTGSYPTYQAALARAGFITFKPDLRGHDESEGEPVSAHTSEKYVIDTLNAIAYLKNYDQVNPGRLGYWGHSNGGQIGLRVAVINSDIEAYNFWAGVVGSHQDMLETYNDNISFLKNRKNPLIQQYGLPSENPDFWNQLDPYNFLEDVTAPIQLHHGTADKSVPIELSESLEEALGKKGKEVKLFKYQGADHNISQNSSQAWQRTIDFFRENLKPVSQAVLVPPLDRPKERITKKPFGIFITPENSPVQPERFRGYHTGVDFEVFPEELEKEVAVKAICAGELIAKSYVNGYGGAAVQSCEIENQSITVLYGHLDLASIKIEEGENLKPSDILGNLGPDKSRETDGERKHLHLAFYKGNEINYAGYVQNESQLSSWINPCLYVCDE